MDEKLVLWGHSDHHNSISSSLWDSAKCFSVAQNEVSLDWMKKCFKNIKPARPLKVQYVRIVLFTHFIPTCKFFYFAPCDPLTFFLWPLWENQDPVRETLWASLKFTITVCAE